MVGETLRCDATLKTKAYDLKCQRAWGHRDYWLGASDYHVGYDDKSFTHVDWDDDGKVVHELSR